MPSILPTPSPSSPNPHPSHPHPTHLPFPAHSPSAPIPLPFRPQPTLFPPPLHSLSIPSPLSPLRYSPNLFICYPVSSCIQLVPSSPRQLVNLQCYSSNLFTCYHVSSRIQLVTSSTHQLVNLPVTLRTCSPVTMSINTANLFPCPLVNPSSCKLFLSSYFFVGICPKHCNANSSLFVTDFYLQKHNYQ